MRASLVLLVLISPAHAWTFIPDPVCTITHTEGGASLTVTYDPSLPEPYALQLDTAEPLPTAPIFALDFGGFAISTNRHRLNDDRTRLTVTDRGFGNVLSGLSAGTGARAMIGESATRFPTDDAAAAVDAFRACPEAVTS